MDPLELMFSVTDSSAFPENRLKSVVNQYLAQMCLSTRCETLLRSIESFTDGNYATLQEKFVRRQILEHLGTFHDGGSFALRLTKSLLEAASALELHNQIAAKMLALFRKIALEELSNESAKFIGRFDFESCKPLIDFVLSIIGSKQFICGRSCSHENDCTCLQIAVSIVRAFLLSLDSNNSGNELKIISICCGNLAPSVVEGLMLNIDKDETIDVIENLHAKNRLVPESGEIRCLVFCESPALFGNPVDNENRKTAKDYTCYFGVSYSSFKEKYCIETAQTFQSLGVGVLFCQKIVDEELVFECARRSIAIIDRLGAEDCVYLQTFLGISGSLWPATELTKVDSFNIGTLNDVKLVEISPKRRLLSLKKSSDFRTLIVSSPIEDLLPDMKALCECSLAGLKLTLANRRIVLKGGGYWQVELANSVFGKVLSNLENLSSDFALSRGQIIRCLVAFCSALAHTGIRIDKTLVSNLRAELRSSFMLEILNDEERISQFSSSFNVFDCFLMARSAFDTAVCSALTLISTDKFIDERNTRRFLENSKQLRT